MNTNVNTSPFKSPSRSVPALLADQVGKALDALFDWQYRIQTRRQLMELDDHMLRDIGLSHADVEHEITKKFWQA